MSYEEGTINYRVWDIEGKKVVISWDVVFDTQPESTNLEQGITAPTPPSQTLLNNDTEEDQIPAIVQPALPPPVLLNSIDWYRDSSIRVRDSNTGS
jgi:hypothetical protein